MSATKKEKLVVSLISALMMAVLGWAVVGLIIATRGAWLAVIGSAVVWVLLVYSWPGWEMWRRD